MTSKIRQLAFEGAPTQVIRRAALAQGMNTLYHDVSARVLRGDYDAEEVMSIAKKEETD